MTKADAVHLAVFIAIVLGIVVTLLVKSQHRSVE